MRAGTGRRHGGPETSAQRASLRCRVLTPDVMARLTGHHPLLTTGSIFSPVANNYLISMQAKPHLLFLQTNGSHCAFPWLAFLSRHVTPYILELDLFADQFCRGI